MAIKTNKNIALTIAILMIAMFFPVKTFAQSHDSANARIMQLEKQMQTMSRAVYRGEQPASTVSNAQNNAEYNSSAANTELRLSEIERQMRELTGLIEKNEHKINLLQKKLKQIEQNQTKQQAENNIRNNNTQQTINNNPQNEVPVLYATPKDQIKNQLGVLKVPNKDTNQNPNIVTTNEPPMLVTSPTPANNDIKNLDITPEKMYEYAYTDIKDGKYKKAAEKFEKFIDQHPENKLAPNAQYWLAETYYVRGKYQQSAKMFAQGYEQYPKSAKAVDNLLKLGLSLSKSGKTNEACIALSQLKKQFPNKSGAVMQRGRQEQKRIGCQ